MTGFASLSGANERLNWTWELRSVNAKGLDLRIRLADGFEALEPDLRRFLGKTVSRGNVTVGLRVQRNATLAAAELDAAALDNTLQQLATIRANAERMGLATTPSTPAEIALMPGVLRSPDSLAPEIPDEMRLQIPALCESFAEMRAGEGRALSEILLRQVEEMAELAAKTTTTAEARSARQGEVLTARVAALLASTDIPDPARLAQELAVLAVKADVTEEIDRLTAHVATAREMITSGGVVGRKLDFLMQEFNREANTLCSKSGSTELTGLGLSLKVLIDQMREQVQNIE